MKPVPPGKDFPGLSRRCPLRWSPHLPVLSTAALLLVLSLRPEGTAAARENAGPRLPRFVRAELERSLERLSGLAAALSAEPAGAGACTARLALYGEVPERLLCLSIERLDGSPAASLGARPSPLRAGQPAFDRVHRDVRGYIGAPHFDPEFGRWCVTLTAPLIGGDGDAALLRAELDLSALLAERQR
jgi:hypothetical protein